MTLYDYRKKRGLTQSEFAAILGISHSYFSQIENGQGCSLILALRIEDATGGNVKPADLAAARRARLKS